MESREYLLDELKLIEKWEKDQRGLWFWERLSRLPFKVLDRVTPAFLQDKIGSLLDELWGYIQSGGQYLTNEKKVFGLIEKHTDRKISELTELQEVPVEVMKKATLELTKKRKKAATVQGASTGVGGIFTLVIDIPAVLAIAISTLQEIATIHGYDLEDKRERVFILKCLQYSAADVVGRQAILNELSHFDADDQKTREVISQLQGWREVTVTFSEQFGWKKLFQLVPVAGIIFGAFANRSMINDLAETGMMLYQKRRIMERLGSFSNTNA